MSGWRPIEKSPPDRYGGRKWKCPNHPALRQKCVSNTVWGGPLALKATLIRHMANCHPDRPWGPEVADLDEEATRPRPRTLHRAPSGGVS